MKISTGTSTQRYTLHILTKLDPNVKLILRKKSKIKVRIQICLGLTQITLQGILVV